MACHLQAKTLHALFSSGEPTYEYYQPADASEP